MPLSLRFTLLSAPAALRVLAVLALAAGLGVWASILLGPPPRPPPPPRAARPPPAGPDGAAVLSVDGGPPLAWRAGAEVAPGIVLRDIAADGVTVEQSGRVSRLATPASQAAPPGISLAK
jgi:general secretion pathway protein C